MEPKIILYEQDTTNFDNNGIYVLDNIIMNDEIKWGLFGVWEFTFDIPDGTPLDIEVETGQIVKAPTPNFKEPQLFFIDQIKRERGRSSVTAIHVYNKLKHIFLTGSLVRDKTISEAIKQLIGTGRALDFNFTFYTDKPNARVDTHFELVNALQAIADESQDNSIITQTQTEFTANNYQLQLVNRIGEDRGVDLRYGRDILMFAETKDASDVVGRIVPVGKDDFVIPSEYGGPYISLDDIPELGEKFNMIIHKTRKIEFKDVMANYGENEGDEEALPISEAARQLKRLGEREFKLRQIHKPTYSYNINFMAINNLSIPKQEKERLKKLQDIRPGDTVTVVDEKGREIKERLIGYNYSPSREEYMRVTLANKTLELSALEYEKERILGGGTFTA